jgi:MinD-like ATPase involved in chromosome partitioning or flagellar assembly
MVVIGVTSGKGGVGKTTVVSNLATALAEFGRNVVVLDCNLTTSHIALHFGMQHVDNSIIDVLKKKVKIQEAVYYNPIASVKIVPSTLKQMEEVEIKNLKKLICRIANSRKDFVLIDSSPGFGNNVKNVLKASDKVLIVTTPTFPSLADGIKIAELAKKMKKEFFVILNKIRNKKYEVKTEIIERMFGVKINVIIPEDDKIPESIAFGAPVVVYKPYSKSAVAFKKFAASLIGEEYKPSFRERIEWLLGRALS